MAGEEEKCEGREGVKKKLIEKEREQGENVMPIILYREVLFRGLLFKSDNT